MSARAIEIDEGLLRVARAHRRSRPLEDARGWRRLIGVSWGPGQVVLAALLLAVLAHAGVFALWLQETPTPPPPFVESQRLTVQLLDSTPEMAPDVALQPEIATPEVAVAPEPTRTPASRPAALIEPEVTAPAVAEADSESVSIDWSAAVRGAARAQVDSTASASTERLGAAVPRLPGESSKQWSQPSYTPAKRMQQVAGMLSTAQLVGGDGLHSLVAAGPMEQEIDSRLRDLQSECYAAADGRLQCPSRRR